MLSKIVGPLGTSLPLPARLGYDFWFPITPRLADAVVNPASANGGRGKPKRTKQVCKRGNHGHHPRWELSPTTAPKNLTSQESDAILKSSTRNAVFGIFSDFAAVARRERSDDGSAPCPTGHRGRC